MSWMPNFKLLGRKQSLLSPRFCVSVVWTFYSPTYFWVLNYRITCFYYLLQHLWFWFLILGSATLCSTVQGCWTGHQCANGFLAESWQVLEHQIIQDQPRCVQSGTWTMAWLRATYCANGLEDDCVTCTSRGLCMRRCKIWSLAEELQQVNASSRYSIAVEIFFDNRRFIT
jgi:hypothetical protein